MWHHHSGLNKIFLLKLIQSDVFISIDQRSINLYYSLHIFMQYRLFRVTWLLNVYSLYIILGCLNFVRCYLFVSDLSKMLLYDNKTVESVLWKKTKTKWNLYNKQNELKQKLFTRESENKTTVMQVDYTNRSSTEHYIVHDTGQRRWNPCDMIICKTILCINPTKTTTSMPGLASDSLKCKISWIQHFKGVLSPWNWTRKNS